MNIRFIDKPLPANVKTAYNALQDSIGSEFSIHIHPANPGEIYGCTPCGATAIKIRNTDARIEQ